MNTYCIVCRKDTENKNRKVFKTKNERLILKSVCSECNNKGFSVKMKDLVYYQVLVLELLCQKYLC